MFIRAVVAALAVLGIPALACAQPHNVRAWYAQGQVFVVWEMTAPPALPTDTVEIYSSAAAQINVANMDRIGRVFFPEYTGARLKDLVPAARLLIPTPAGGTYRLAGNEGVFVYTPRAAGVLFFAVVDTGSTVVNAANSAATAFLYDPAGDPVRPHPQFAGATPGGFPFTAYVVWADGRDDDHARPDVPVLASASKNGVPHVFTITEPIAGLPAGPLSCLFAHHGGGGEFQLFRPGVPARANMQLPLDDGIVVTPDDSFFARVENDLQRVNTSWFGYTPSVDPFDAAPRVAPPDGSVVVNFTQRRVMWILDWLLGPSSPYAIDPERVAMVGHSGGGRGTSHLTRLAPERFCAAVMYTPAISLQPGTGGSENFLRGTNDQNLPTNLPRPQGKPGEVLGVTDIFTTTTRISPTVRDFPFTRLYLGKRDTENAAAWTPDMRAAVDAVHDSGMGIVFAWDEREHGVEKWDTDQPNPPEPDIGQWVAPIRSRRCAAQYLVDTYRASQSYPGFFNSDHNPGIAGRQPDPGPGDPNLGDPWGTWEGYFEWDTGTIVDEEGRWACTVFVTALSSTSIDNAPASVVSITTDVIPRKTLAFNPAAGTLVAWRSVDVASTQVVQSGTSVAATDGTVLVTGLNVPKDPARVRLMLVVCRADVDGNRVVNSTDVSEFINLWMDDQMAGTLEADWNGDGTSNSTDVSDFINDWFVDVVRGCG